MAQVLKMLTCHHLCACVHVHVHVHTQFGQAVSKPTCTRVYFILDRQFSHETLCPNLQFLVCEDVESLYVHVHGLYMYVSPPKLTGLGALSSRPKEDPGPLPIFRICYLNCQITPLGYSMYSVRVYILYIHAWTNLFMHFPWAYPYMYVCDGLLRCDINGKVERELLQALLS